MPLCINIIRKNQVVFLITKFVSHGEIAGFKSRFKHQSLIRLVIRGVVWQHYRCVYRCLASPSVPLQTLIIRNQFFHID